MVAYAYNLSTQSSEQDDLEFKIGLFHNVTELCLRRGVSDFLPPLTYNELIRYDVPRRTNEKYRIDVVEFQLNGI